MYSLLICDDEKLIRQGIKLRINNMDYKFRDIYEAFDEASATEIMGKYYPKIVITDIRLKNSNGLQLIEKLITRFPDTQYIIISGYSEFEYAKKAIQLGVCSYLLKPIDENELNNALGLAIRNLDELRAADDMYEEKLQLKINSSNIQLENIINSIFLSFKDEDYLFERVQELWNIPKNCKFQCAVIRVENSSFEVSEFDNNDIELLSYGINNIAEELIEDKNIGFRFFRDLNDMNKLIIIIAHPDQSYLEKQTDMLALGLMHSITKMLGIIITISISTIHPKITKNMYVETQKAENYKFVQGVNKVYYYNATNLMGDNITLPIHHLELLRRCIDRKNIPGIPDIVHGILQERRESDAVDEYVFLVYLYIMNLVLNLYPDTLHIFNRTEENFTNPKLFGRFENSNQIELKLIELLTEVCRYKIEQQNDITMNCKSFMKQAKDYIDRNYMNSISLKDVAQYFNMNATYFSILFKQEIGVPFTRYIRDIRIKNACELLKNLSVSTEQVAYSVGFNDPLYFYRVFKQTMGITPTEYRSRLEEHN